MPHAPVLRVGLWNDHRCAAARRTRASPWISAKKPPNSRLNQVSISTATPPAQYLRRQSPLAKKPSSQLFRRSQFPRRQNRLPGPRNRRHRLHSRRQRKRSPGPGKQFNQAEQTKIQRPAPRRQNVSIYTLHRLRKIPARLRHPPPDRQRWLDLFRTIFPAT